MESESMPPVVKQSLLLQKLGARGAQIFEEVKNREAPSTGGSDLPPGISGIAHLKECKFALVAAGKKSAGSLFFYASAIVVEPSVFTDKKNNQFRTAGMRTQVIEMLCDTPDSAGRKTIKEHFNHIVGQLMLLSGMKLTTIKFDQLEPFAAMLVQKKPYFKFRTWQPPAATEGKYKDQESRIIHLWDEAVPDYKPGIVNPSAAATTDDSIPAITPAASLPAAPNAKKPITNGTPTTATPAAGSAQQFNEMTAAEGLLARANDGDAHAQNDLGELAMKLGWSEQQVKESPTWEALFAMANNGPTGAETESAAEPSPEDVPEIPDTADDIQPDEQPEEESQEDQFPAVGMACKYKPYNKNSKKYDLPEVDCELLSHDSVKNVWTLKNLDDGKTQYTGVKPEKLIPIA
jgi:hypothetical protein